LYSLSTLQICAICGIIVFFIFPADFADVCREYSAYSAGNNYLQLWFMLSLQC